MTLSAEERSVADRLFRVRGQSASHAVVNLAARILGDTLGRINGAVELPSVSRIYRVDATSEFTITLPSTVTVGAEIVLFHYPSAATDTYGVIIDDTGYRLADAGDAIAIVGDETDGVESWVVVDFSTRVAQDDVNRLFISAQRADDGGDERGGQLVLKGGTAGRTAGDSGWVQIRPGSVHAPNTTGDHGLVSIEVNLRIPLSAAADNETDPDELIYEAKDPGIRGRVRFNTVSGNVEVDDGSDWLTLLTSDSGVINLATMVLSTTNPTLRIDKGSSGTAAFNWRAGSGDQYQFGLDESETFTFNSYVSSAWVPNYSLATGVAGFTFLGLTDGVAAPSATAGMAKLFVDTSDGDLKVIYGDGTVKLIVVDT